MATPRGGWIVECPAYKVGPFPSRDAAERNMATIDALAACMFDHKVVEVDA